jgi:hypothetical protein
METKNDVIKGGRLAGWAEMASPEGKLALPVCHPSSEREQTTTARVLHALDHLTWV